MQRYSKAMLRAIDVTPDGQRISLSLRTAEGVIEFEFNLNNLRRSVRHMWVAVRAAEERQSDQASHCATLH